MFGLSSNLPFQRNQVAPCPKLVLKVEKLESFLCKTRSKICLFYEVKQLNGYKSLEQVPLPKCAIHKCKAWLQAPPSVMIWTINSIFVREIVEDDLGLPSINHTNHIQCYLFYLLWLLDAGFRCSQNETKLLKTTSIIFQQAVG